MSTRAWTEPLVFRNKRRSLDDFNPDWFRVCDPKKDTMLSLRGGRDFYLVLTTSPVSIDWFDDLKSLLPEVSIEYRAVKGSYGDGSRMMGYRIIFPAKTPPAKTRRPIDVFPASEWFVGDFSAEAMKAALTALTEALIDVTRTDGDEDRAILPEVKAAYTGLKIVQTTFPRSHPCVIVKTFDREKIASIPQQRIELLPAGGRGGRKTFYYYDASRFYTSLLQNLALPVGEPQWEEAPTYDVRPAFYEIEATVPETWQHAGIFVTAKGTWPKTPGETFRAWVTWKELYILKSSAFRQWQESKGLAPLPDWDVRLLNRIVFGDEASSKVYGFNGFASRIAEIERCHEDSPHRDAIVGALKKMVDATIGLLGAGPGVEMMTQDDLDRLPIIDNRRRIDEIEPGVFSVSASQGQGVQAYHVAAMLWGAARARITQWALCVPPEHLVAIHVDALLTTVPVVFPRFTSQDIGQMRLKASPFEDRMPRDELELKALLARAASHESETHGA